MISTIRFFWFPRKFQRLSFCALCQILPLDSFSLHLTILRIICVIANSREIGKYSLFSPLIAKFERNFRAKVFRVMVYLLLYPDIPQISPLLSLPWSARKHWAYSNSNSERNQFHSKETYPPWVLQGSLVYKVVVYNRCMYLQSDLKCARKCTFDPNDSRDISLISCKTSVSW